MLEVENISFSVRKKPLLDALSLSFALGSLTAIIGGNGAGKSTLIKLISGEYTTQSGAVRWQNQALKKYAPRALAKSRAVMTQKVNMSVDFSVKEVVMLGRYPHFEARPTTTDFKVVEQALKEFEIDHLAERNYQQLSGGEQQRVQLARTFAQISRIDKEPTFLLLDEPLNNLDVRHQFAFLKRLQHYVQQGNVALLVIHDLNLAAQFANQAVLLKNGHLLASGKPSEVFTAPYLSTAYQFPVSVHTATGSTQPIIQFGTGQMLNPAFQSDYSTQITQLV